MAMDAGMLCLIHRLGFSGAFVFEWADEWFKHSWNTVDLERPGDRSALWTNALTVEEHFGVIASDPSLGGRLRIDGRTDDWSGVGQTLHESRRGVREIRAAHDEGSLYLSLRFEQAPDWSRQRLTLGFDVAPGGNGGLPGTPGAGSEGPQRADADTALTLGPGDRGRFWIRADNDPYVRIYGEGQRYFRVAAADLRPATGAWDPYRQPLSRPLIHPVSRRRTPMQSFVVPARRAGRSSRSDEQAVWAARGPVVELRLPWALLGFADPSSHQVLVAGPGGALSTTPSPGVGITVASPAGSGSVTYRWDAWNRVKWTERPKTGIERLADALASVAKRP